MLPALGFRFSPQAGFTVKLLNHAVRLSAQRINLRLQRRRLLFRFQQLHFQFSDILHVLVRQLMPGCRFRSSLGKLTFQLVQTALGFFQ
ncbi:hypothetical protein D3C75_1094430 [compost metagenome]